MVYFHTLKQRIGRQDTKHQKQKGYQTQLHFLYQEANIKKTCIPCRLYHLLNITGKNITTVSFPKIFTKERRCTFSPQFLVNEH